MLHDLSTLLSDHQSGMSSFQDDHLVTVRAGGTPYGQYKQSLRELYKRVRGLIDELYGENGLKRLELKQSTLETKNDPESEIDKIHTRLLLDQARVSIKDTYREFIRFWQQASALKSLIGDLTPERRDALDRELWEFRVREMAAIDFIQHGRLGNVTVEFVTSLSDEMRSRVYPLIFDPKRHDELINEYINRRVDFVEFTALPLPENASLDQIEERVQCLIGV